MTFAVRPRLAAFAGFLLLAACADNSAQQTAPAEGTMFESGQGGELQSTDQFQAGRDVFDADNHPGLALYGEHCASCHEGGVPKSPHRNWLEMMAPDMILAAMNGGIMSQQSAALSDMEKRQVAEYLVRRPLADYQPPAPPAQCQGDAARMDINKPPAAVGWGHDPRRFIPADVAGLDAEDVAKLKLKWAYAFPSAVRARSQPAIAMGAVFVGSQDGTVYAFDLETGCARWTYRASAEVRTAIVLEPFEAGDEAAKPRLFFGDLFGRVYALDAKTGALLWSQRMDDHPNATITATPTLHDGRLYVAVSSLEVTSAADPAYPCCTFRGAVVALDAASGDRIWKNYSIPEAPKQHSTTSVGTPVLGPSGAPFWNSPMIDPKRGQLYVGSGENYSSPADGHSNAVFAFDLATGKKRWHLQTLANDAWNVACMMADNPNCPAENGPDLDYSASPLLIDLGDGKDILVAGQKTGMVYGINPDDGAILWRTRAGRGGTQGGIHFGMAAAGTTVFVPMNDMEDARDGRVFKGEAMPGLSALDAVTGDILWHNRAPKSYCEGRGEFCDPGISAVVTAMPGVVFAGHLDGVLRAYDQASGDIIWSDDTLVERTTVTGAQAHGGGMSGPGVAIGDGHVVANSGYGLYFHMPGNMLLVYGLDDDTE